MAGFFLPHREDGNIQYFYLYLATNPAKTLMNPMFGELNYEQQISILYKHTRHHLKQFGLID